VKGRGELGNSFRPFCAFFPALRKGKAGDDKTGTTVALVVLFGPLGFLKKGKQAIIKSGTAIKVYTDEAKSVQVKAGAVAVIPAS
jgi:hypothetical protein